MRDVAWGCTVIGMFTTVSGCVPTVLVSGALTVWKNALTCTTTGVDFYANCSGGTGLNSYAIRTNTSSTIYSCGAHYTIALSAGLVCNQAVTNVVVDEFTISPPVVTLADLACATIFTVAGSVNSVEDPVTSTGGGGSGVVSVVAVPRR